MKIDWENFALDIIIGTIIMDYVESIIIEISWICVDCLDNCQPTRTFLGIEN